MNTVSPERTCRLLLTTAAITVIAIGFSPRLSAADLPLQTEEQINDCVKKAVVFDGDQPLQRAIVNGRGGDKVHLYAQYPGQCTADSAGACQGKAYLVPGDSIVIGKTCGGWAFIQYTGSKHTSEGWIALSGIAQQSAHSNPAVCDDLSNGRVDEVEFSHMHAVNANAYYGFAVKPGLAKIDIENDGHADNIVQAEYGYHNCFGVVLAATDDTRTRVIESPLNDLLNGKVASQDIACGLTLKPFVRAGVVYIESLDSTGTDRNVYVIRGNHDELVCGMARSPNSRRQSITNRH